MACNLYFKYILYCNLYFDGMLQRIEVSVSLQRSNIGSLPFGSDIYILAAFLDPKFKLRWIDLEVKLSSIETEELRQNVKGY